MSEQVTISAAEAFFGMIEIAVYYPDRSMQVTTVADGDKIVARMDKELQRLHVQRTGAWENDSDGSMVAPGRAF